MALTDKDTDKAEFDGKFDDLMNEPGYTGVQGETGSFRDFYLEISYGEFDAQTDVMGWFTSAENHTERRSRQYGPCRAPIKAARQMTALFCQSLGRFR